MTSSYASIFQKSFGAFITLSDEMLDFLDSIVKVKKFDSKTLITEAGGTEKYFYLVVSGVQVVYLLDQKGEKAILGFTYPGNVSGIYDSFIYQRPSHYFMESLTPSELLAISKQSFDQLFERFPEFLKWRVDFIERILVGRGQREVEMLTLSAKERFDLFMRRCPEELLQIPQKYLAGYLNMKPETFSRLRARRD